MQSPLETLRRLRTLRTGHVSSLPVLVLMPHSRCNCRCVMCDIWKANHNRRELSPSDLQPHLEAFRRLKVRWIVLSGGEALMHSNLWALCGLLRTLGIRLTLLSTGLLLEAHAAEVTEHCDEVIVSLDGSPDTHDRIRNIPRAFERLAAGVVALRAIDDSYRITGRSVIQRLNFRDLGAIIDTARELELDRVSFLAADTSSDAFNHPEGWSQDQRASVALDAEESEELAEVVERCLDGHRQAFSSGFVAETPAQMRDIVGYYRALNGAAAFSRRRCNAPWVSTVVEADGTVRPCFFHRPIGNILSEGFEQIVNSERAVRFRQELDVSSDPICQRCVCTLHLSPLVSVEGPH